MTSSQQPNAAALRRCAATRCVRLRMARDKAQTYWESIFAEQLPVDPYGGLPWYLFKQSNRAFNKAYHAYLTQYGTPPPSTKWGL